LFKYEENHEVSMLYMSC